MKKIIIMIKIKITIKEKVNIKNGIEELRTTRIKKQIKIKIK